MAIHFFILPSRVLLGLPRWGCVCYLLFRSWDGPGKNTGVDCHFLLLEIFPTQRWSLGLPHCRKNLPSEPPGKLQRIHLPMQEMQEIQIPSLGQEDPLVQEMATHSHILVLKAPWAEEPRGLQSVGSQTVRQDWDHTECH